MRKKTRPLSRDNLKSIPNYSWLPILCKLRVITGSCSGAKFTVQTSLHLNSGAHRRHVANNKFDTVTMRSLRAGNDGAFRHEANCNAPPAFPAHLPRMCNNGRAMHHPTDESRAVRNNTSRGLTFQLQKKKNSALMQQLSFSSIASLVFLFPYTDAEKVEKKKV